MIHLYLDDLRPCPRGFVLARTIEECIQLIDLHEIHILSLDYDMGWGEPTGYEVAKHIVDKQRYPMEIYLHTSSSAGRISMYQLINEHKPDHVMIYDGPMPDAVIKKVGETA